MVYMLNVLFDCIGKILIWKPAEWEGSLFFFIYVPMLEFDWSKMVKRTKNPLFKYEGLGLWC